MRRFHLIELHEQRWYPAVWRQLFQLSMGRAMSGLGALDGVADRFRQLVEEVKPHAVLDLCSGSGELTVSLWESVTSRLQDEARPSLVLSDVYPNPLAFEALRERFEGKVDFYPEPVDACRPPSDGPPVRTIFNALHHFRPEQVRSILADAAENADGIAAFEVTRRTVGNLAQSLLVVPFLSAFFTARLQPVRFRNILWGLLLPVVPVTTALDGFVSNLRTYTVDELTKITDSIESPGFKWDIGQADIPRGGSGLKATYLFGWRRSGRAVS